MLESLLGEGSLLLIFGLLVAAGAGAPISEDLCLLAAGALVQQGYNEIPVGIAAVLSGVVIGDFVLFTISQRLGKALFDTKAFKRLMPEERREKLAGLIERRGGLVVFVGRFLAGLRWPIFATVAVNGYPRSRFVLWDALGACVSVPLVFTLGYLSAGQLETALEKVGDVQQVILGVVASAILLFVAWRLLTRYRATRSAG